MSNNIELIDIKKRIENLKDSYNEMLDKSSSYNVGNAHYRGSKSLKEIDPVFYEVGFNDYVDSEIKDILEKLKNIEINDYDDIDLKYEIIEMINKYGYYM